MNKMVLVDDTRCGNHRIYFLESSLYHRVSLDASVKSGLPRGHCSYILKCSTLSTPFTHLFSTEKAIVIVALKPVPFMRKTSHVLVTLYWLVLKVSWITPKVLQIFSERTANKEKCTFEHLTNGILALPVVLTNFESIEWEPTRITHNIIHTLRTQKR